MRNRRFCLRVVSSDHRPNVSKALDVLGLEEVFSLLRTMASSAERLLQAQSLHLLHETILRRHCREQTVLETVAQGQLGTYLGEGASPGRGLCALVTISCVICFGIIEDIVIINGVAPALGTGRFVRVHAGARHCQLSE